MPASEVSCQAAAEAQGFNFKSNVAKKPNGCTVNKGLTTITWNGPETASTGSIGKKNKAVCVTFAEPEPEPEDPVPEPEAPEPVPEPNPQGTCEEWCELPPVP